MSIHRKKDGRWVAVFYLEGKQQWRYFGRRQEEELAARQLDVDRQKNKKPALILNDHQRRSKIIPINGGGKDGR